MLGLVCSLLNRELKQLRRTWRLLKRQFPAVLPHRLLSTVFA